MLKWIIPTMLVVSLGVCSVAEARCCCRPLRVLAKVVRVVLPPWGR